MFLKTGKLQSFSEQQLVDCDKVDQGCNGGLMDNAFKYIESNPLQLESAYPYTGQDGSCSYIKSAGVGTVASFTDVSPSASQLKAAIAKAPVSVAIEADQSASQLKAAIAKDPVSVAIEADQSASQLKAAIAKDPVSVAIEADQSASQLKAAIA